MSEGKEVKWYRVGEGMDVSFALMFDESKGAAIAMISPWDASIQITPDRVDEGAPLREATSEEVRLAVLGVLAAVLGVSGKPVREAASGLDELGSALQGMLTVLKDNI